MKSSRLDPFSRLTPPTPPKPPVDPHRTAAAFVIRAGKLRRGERLDDEDDQDKKPEPQPGDLIRDAIKRQKEGK